MIEELTPALLFVALLLVLLLASMLTLLASAAVLWRYRRRVALAMAATAGGAAHASPADATAAPDAGAAAWADAPLDARAPAGRLDPDALYRRARREPWRSAWRSTAAGAAFAIVMAVAIGWAFPQAVTTPYAYALYVWGYAWPVVLALVLTGPLGPRGAALAVAAYFAPLAVVTVAALLSDAPAPVSGLDVARLRATITPSNVVYAWFVANAIPTAMLMLFLSRRLRAVGPMLLGLVTLATAGVVATLLGLFSRAGSEWIIQGAVAIDGAARNTGIATPWLLRATLVTLLAGALLAALLAFAGVGWWLLHAVRRAWLRKTLNDRALQRDALWLFFATVYAMWYSMAGLGWAAVAPAAFAVYKGVSAALVRFGPLAPVSAASGRGLTFLRVFSLGRRSDRLFDALSRHWRHVGSIQLITGPDVAHSTLQPHQLLDFLAGRIASHVIGDGASLARRMRERDVQPDRDGLYRVNGFLCQADTWRVVLARLVRGGDAVLMDLRSFAPCNAGCVHELRHLVHHVAMRRCVLLVDASTDRDFLRRTLDDAWRGMPADSPNRALTAGAVPLHRHDTGPRALQSLLRRLCAASVGSQTIRSA